MPYATIDDYQKEFGDDDMPTDSGDKVERALDRASKLIDTYARSSGLAVPLVDAIAIESVKGSLLDIARYFAWPDNSSDEIRKRYEDAIKFLESVSTGKISLVPGEKAVTGSGFRNVQLVRA